MIPIRQLLADAEARLQALDHEVRASGTFAERVAVARAMGELAERRTAVELARLRGYRVRAELAADRAYLAGEPGHLSEFQLDA